MFCGKCGNENVDGVTFCVHCGADMTRLTPSSHSPADTIGDAVTISAEQIVGGKLLGGQYRVIGDKPLGSGGMGEVWKAEDTELGTSAAIKVLPPMIARSEAAIANLKREARIGQQLTHPNICRLYGFHSDGDVKFIVMEYVAGDTLADILSEREDRRMTWEELEPIARQIAEALDFAHNATYSDAAGRKVRGVLHRDIKPGNIMLTADGLAKLLDFGIAREIHSTMTMLTGRASQTPLYASPEQFRGEPMTAASDIYSFAAVLYECLAGHPLVQPHGDLGYQILQKPFEIIPSESEAVNAALETSLAKQAADRPNQASDILLRSSGAAISSSVTAQTHAPQVAAGAADKVAASEPKKLTSTVPNEILKYRSAALARRTDRLVSLAEKAEMHVGSASGTLPVAQAAHWLRRYNEQIACSVFCFHSLGFDALERQLDIYADHIVRIVGLPDLGVFDPSEVRKDVEGGGEYDPKSMKLVNLAYNHACILRDSARAAEYIASAEQCAEKGSELASVALAYAELLEDREMALAIWRRAGDMATGPEFAWLARTGLALGISVGDAETLLQRAEEQARTVQELCYCATSWLTLLANEEAARKCATRVLQLEEPSSIDWMFIEGLAEDVVDITEDTQLATDLLNSMMHVCIDSVTLGSRAPKLALIWADLLNDRNRAADTLREAEHLARQRSSNLRLGLYDWIPIARAWWVLGLSSEAVRAFQEAGRLVEDADDEAELAKALKDSVPAWNVSDFLARGKKKHCFVSTATAESLGWAEDCRELSLLRDLRDTYMMQTAERQAEVEHYYHIAPLIVERIAASGQAHKLWRDVAQRYILPVVRLSEAGNAAGAHQLYREMVEHLSLQWLTPVERATMTADTATAVRRSSEKLASGESPWDPAHVNGQY